MIESNQRDTDVKPVTNATISNNNLSNVNKHSKTDTHDINEMKFTWQIYRDAINRQDIQTALEEK
jgi:hypothetical protein